MDAITDEQRRSGKARHNLSIDLPGQLIEKDIVALHASLVELTGQITRAGLQEMSHSLDGAIAFNFLRYDIQFPEANPRTRGNIEFYIMFRGNDFTGKFLRVNLQGLI